MRSSLFPGMADRHGWFPGCLLLAIGSAGLLASGCGSGAPGQVQGSPLFVPVTDGRIAMDGGASRGVGWADFDQDGDPDLVVANTAGQWNAFYLNTLLGRQNDWRSAEEQSDAGAAANAVASVSFIKASDPGLSPLASVAAAAGRAEGVSWIDYDGDGDLDLHIATRGREPDLFFANEGDDGLVRVTDGPLVRAAGSSMACWADVDLDGWPDVFLVAYGDDQTNTLLRNVGGGEFERIMSGPAAFGHGTGRACAWGDPDGNGLPDLYVGNAREPNELYRNRGGFDLERDLDAGHAVEHIGYSYGLSWADYDGDGDHDLFVANFDRENVLYRNDGAGRLEPVEAGSLAEERGGASKGHAWGDFDLDGDLDLFVANGTYGPDMRNFLYRNDGAGSFVRDTAGAFAMHADTSAGAAWADYDLDGDLDMFVANWGSSDQVNRLYRNTTSESTGNGWIAIRLRSQTPNTHGWGARVSALATIDGGARWMTRWNVPTTGYGSQNELLIHFGLGDAPVVDSLVIEWPSGQVDAHSAVAGRTIWTAVEGAGLAAGESGTESRGV